MLKKALLILLLLSMSSAVHAATAGMKVDKVIDLLFLTKKEVRAKLGNDYQTEVAGYEGHCEGMVYEKLGITLILGQVDPLKKHCVYKIDCNAKVDINGARAGMNFAEVQRILGKAAVETDIGEVGNIYHIRYTIGQGRVTFESRYQSGKESKVYITGK